MAAAYQGGLDPEFIAMADVHLVVADTTYPAHSQFLAAESGVLRAVLRDTEPVPTAEQPWTTRSLDCYSSGTVESFLYHVYKSPLFHAKTQAWDMLDIADHLDCRRLLEAARAALESVDGDICTCHSSVPGFPMTHQDVVGRLLQCERHHLPKYKEACQQFIFNNRSAIPDLHVLPKEMLVELLMRSPGPPALKHADTVDSWSIRRRAAVQG